MKLQVKRRLFLIFLPVLSCLFTPVSARTPDDAPRDVEIGTGGEIRPESPDRTDIEGEFEWHAHLLWESRYVSQGRDSLAGKGIYSLSTDFRYKDINIVPWIADGIDADYTEFNLNIVYGRSLLDNLEGYIGYNRILARESGSNSSDNEISLELDYFPARHLQVTTSAYYSFDAEGAFVELAIRKNQRLNDVLSLHLGATLGFNAGYIPDGHDGINHAEILASASYRVIKAMDVYAYTGYTQAIDRDANRHPGDVLLRDLFWGGIGLSYRF